MFHNFLCITSRLYRLCGVFFGIIVAIVTYGCTAQQIQYQALAHNQAFSASADKILLTNIVRSSRILPVDYTAVTEYKAKEVASGSIVGKLPFGADALRAFNIDPSVSVGPGIASLDIKDFAQQKESFTKLHEDIEIQSFTNLIDAGWDPRLVSTMLLQNIRIRGEFLFQVFIRSNAICDLSRKRGSMLCQAIDEALLCDENKKELNYILNTRLTKESLAEEVGYWVNSGDNKCQFLMFQSVLNRLSLLGVRIDITSTKKLVPYFGITRDSKELRKIYEDVNEQLSGKNRVALEFVGRSTHLMVRFLGQLARSQLFASGIDHWNPSILIDEKKVPLFLIQRADTADVKMAITTEFEGEMYGIPDPDYGNQLKHMSLYLFSYVRIRLDQAYAQAKLPPSNTLILR